MDLEKEVLRIFEEEGLTYREIADRIGITYNQVRYLLQKGRKQGKSGVMYLDKKKPATSEQLDSYIKAMKDLQEKAKELDNKQVKASIAFDTDKPIGVAWWGDVHVGALGVNYGLLEKDIRTMRDEEGLYVLGAGDYIDNYISGTPQGGQYEQIIQPGMQNVVMKRYFQELKEKVLCLVKGCHDDWLKKQSDRDYIGEICELTDSYNLWHGGEVRFYLGEQEYLWRVRHKYKYQSSLNLENAMRRINEIQGPCDVAGEAHLHNGYIMERHLMGEYRVMVRTGSYKVWDEYAQKIGGHKGKPGVPVIIMFPDRRELLPVMGLDRAVKVLRGVREDG